MADYQVRFDAYLDKAGANHNGSCSVATAGGIAWQQPAEIEISNGYISFRMSDSQFFFENTTRMASCAATGYCEIRSYKQGSNPPVAEHFYTIEFCHFYSGLPGNTTKCSLRVRPDQPRIVSS